jgi:hypothetical protein
MFKKIQNLIKTEKNKETLNEKDNSPLSKNQDLSSNKFFLE